MDLNINTIQTESSHEGQQTHEKDEIAKPKNSELSNESITIDKDNSFAWRQYICFLLMS